MIAQDNIEVNKPGLRTRIGRAWVAASILSLTWVFVPGMVRSQTITFAGDAAKGEGGRWMKSKGEEWARETGVPTRYITRPLSTTETLMIWQQDGEAQTLDISIYLREVMWH